VVGLSHLEDSSPGRLEKELIRLREDDPRDAAEIAYALTRIYYDEDYLKQAQRFGEECIALLDQCSIKTPEDAAGRFQKLGGVDMPNFLDPTLVRNRFPRLNL
jgi:hypothetical protein